LENENSLSVFPNPVLDLVNLQYTLPQTGDVIITVYDANGKKLWRWKLINEPAGLHTIPVNTKLLSAGIYFVEWETGADKKIVKFSKS
jgi:hypothetical protein